MKAVSETNQLEAEWNGGTTTLPQNILEQLSKITPLIGPLPHHDSFLPV